MSISDDLVKQWMNLERVDRSKIEQWKMLGQSIGKANILNEISAAYVSSTKPLVAHFSDDILAKDFEALRRSFHKMKSGCGSMGFTRLQKICEYSEDLAGGIGGHHDMTPFVELTQIIREEFEYSLEVVGSL